MIANNFSYDPDTGTITRIRSRGNVRAGSVVGRPDNRGYLRVHFDGKDYKAHRLAWFLYYGEWPSLQLDHINGNKQDNRIVNLRQCTTEQNCANQHGPRKNNRLGCQGVHRIVSSGKYRSVFRGAHLGCFSTLEEASAVYQSAKQGYMNESRVH